MAHLDLAGWIVSGVVAAAGAAAGDGTQSDFQLVAQRPWFEARTAHFNLYSCAPTQDVAKVAARLEQFREVYSLLAGAHAVASPPILVMAYPDPASMRPFLPLYQGKPASLTAFFKRGSDENLIVLPVRGYGPAVMEILFHEYAHLLLRHNDPFWPLWLKEGMADIYGTFEVTGPHGVRIGKPLARHLGLLAEQPLLPLKNLFEVNHDSPEYNQREHQGVFYAQSWLLTHFLMIGDKGSHKAAFGHLTTLLRQGQPPVQAFSNALRTPLPVLEAQLRRYLEQKKFDSLDLAVRADISAGRAMTTRGLSAVERSFRLGDQLLRVGQLEQAESFFRAARTLAPNSPLPLEGLGFLASERDQPEEAVRHFQQAEQRGPLNFLGHYVYAREKYRLTSPKPGRFVRVSTEVAAEIRAELEKSLALMPEFGPAHHLLGFLDLVQGENLAEAEKHLQRAIQLEPENQSYLLSLAQAQMGRRDLAAAQRTLEQLRLPYVDAELRAQADELTRAIGSAR